MHALRPDLPYTPKRHPSPDPTVFDLEFDNYPAVAAAQHPLVQLALQAIVMLSPWRSQPKHSVEIRKVV